MEASRNAGFKPLIDFPEFDKRYESPELFPLFKNRVLNPHRKDFLEYLQTLDLDRSHQDPLQILAITGGERQTDSFEVFPKIDKNADNTFCCRFFLHGLRHVPEDAQRRALSLAAGEPLRVSLELNNPVTGLAIQLTTNDYHFIGWAPRYLITDLLGAIRDRTQVQGAVVRVNEQGVPLNRRVLIELSGSFPPNFEPMSGTDFQSIH